MKVIESRVNIIILQMVIKRMFSIPWRDHIKWTFIFSYSFEEINHGYIFENLKQIEKFNLKK